MTTMSIGRLATRGGVSLIARQALAFVISTAGGIALARLLTPSDFGAYAFILFAQAFGKLLVDGGLTSTLVRQREAPEPADWNSVFSVQLILAVVLAGAIAASTPLVRAVFVGVGGFVGANLLSAASVLVAPAISITFARFERELRFDRLALLTLIQPIVFNVVGPLLALLGGGVLSLGMALLVSNIATLVVAISAGSLPPAPTLRLIRMRPRLRFGVPFIGSGLVSNLKDAVNPLLVGAVVGAAAVGYVRWSQQVAALCTYLVVAISPMLFALFSRLLNEPERLSRMVSSALFWSNAITAPLAILLTIFIVPITRDLYGTQWLPAIPLYYLLCFTNLISPTTTALLALMNAIGRPAIAFAFTGAWFAGTWVLVPALVLPFGALGYGIANAAVQLIGIVLVLVAHRAVAFSAVRSIVLPWAVAAASCVPAYLLESTLDLHNLLVIVCTGLGSLLVFTTLIRLLAHQESSVLLTMLRRERPA